MGKKGGRNYVYVLLRALRLIFAGLCSSDPIDWLQRREHIKYVGRSFTGKVIIQTPHLSIFKV